MTRRCNSASLTNIGSILNIKNDNDEQFIRETETYKRKGMCTLDKANKQNLVVTAPG